MIWYFLFRFDIKSAIWKGPVRGADIPNVLEVFVCLLLFCRTNIIKVIWRHIQTSGARSGT